MNRYVHLTVALGAMGLLALLLVLAGGAQPAAGAGTDPLAPHASGDTIKVPDDYPTIQAAIDAAAEGDAVLVADGTYWENLSITEGITLSGGWNISFTQRTPGSSYIDGQGLGRVISITCASSDTVVTVDGFSLVHGNATGWGGSPAISSVADGGPSRGEMPAPDPLSPEEHLARLRAELAGAVAQGLYPGGRTAYQAMLDRVEQQMAQLEQARTRPGATQGTARAGADCGGGLYSWNASLHLLNSTIAYNIASLDGDGCGGGVFVGHSAPSGTIIGASIFEENIASAAYAALGLGGGLYVLQAPGVRIEGNVFQDNAGISAGVVSNAEGGGLYLADSHNVVLRGNRFVRNTANAGWESHKGWGGGALLHGVYSATVASNTFHQNLGIVHGEGGGGGLALFHSEDVLITDNEVVDNWGTLFQPNRAGSGGGGVLIYHNDHITLTGNTIQDNAATVSGSLVGSSTGGGLDVQDLRTGRIAENAFTGNVGRQIGHSGWGGGASLWAALNVGVADNVFAGNRGSLTDSGSGGGLFLLNSFNTHVQHNRFMDNVAGAGGNSYGGGFHARGEGPYNVSNTVDANLFLDNHASADPTSPFPSYGGAACSMAPYGFVFTNNVVAGNTAHQGGGLYLVYAQQSVVANNTLAGNGSSAVLVELAHVTPVTFTNNIVVSHTVGISLTEGTTATVRYTLWQDNDTDIGGSGAVSQTHPVSGDPAFANPAADDYHLTVGSAAINAGDPAGVPPAPPEDTDGVMRPVGVAVDLGAYEWQGHWHYLPFVARDWRAHTGWAAGEAVDGYGTIIHTTDGGTTWVRQGTAGEIPDVVLGGTAAIDRLNAWVVGDMSTILRTRDGGLTWELQEVPAEAADAGLCGVYALDGNTAWVGGAGTADAPGVILHTTDGGQTWTRQGQDLAQVAGLCGVYASDAEHAWLVGEAEPGNEYGTILRTLDGGTTWERVPYRLTTEVLSPGLISIHGVDADTLWAVGSSQALYSADGGLTWVDRPPHSGLYDINGVAALDRDSVWVVVDNGGIYRSDDAGASWKQQAIPQGLGGDYVLRISAVDTQTAWAVTQPDPRFPSNPGHVLHTSDGGQTWVTQTLPVTPGFWGVSFVR